MRIVIVTGAAGNLGQAVVKKFLAEGCYVIGAIRPSDTRGAGIAHKNFETAPVDLADEAATDRFVAAVIEKHKQIDVAVLTAGGFAMGKIADTAASDIAGQYRLNFATAYNTARPVFAQMLKQKNGRIFMIGSRPGFDMHSSKGMVAYGLSKSMLFRLAELMNDEAKGSNVVTGMIVPSTIDTPQNRQAMPDADTARWVRPEQIAEVIWFYSSAGADIIREPVIRVYNNA